jgi:hypothetical protein
MLAAGGAKSGVPLNCEPIGSRVRGMPSVGAAVNLDAATRLHDAVAKRAHQSNVSAAQQRLSLTQCVASPGGARR